MFSEFSAFSSTRLTIKSWFTQSDGINTGATSDSTDRNHSFDSPGCSHTNAFWYLNDVLLFFQGSERIFQRNLIHVRTAHAAEPEHLFLGISRGDVLHPSNIPSAANNVGLLFAQRI